MNNLKRTLPAVLAAVTLGSIAAGAQAAGDITVYNGSQKYMSPYVKTNCWSPDFITEGPDTWVYFGSVWPDTQFTWDRFYVILDPHCKNPVVKFTFVETGSPAPVSVVPELTQLTQYDATENYRIELGDKTVITGRP